MYASDTVFVHGTVTTVAVQSAIRVLIGCPGKYLIFLANQINGFHCCRNF